MKSAALLAIVFAFFLGTKNPHKPDPTLKFQDILCQISVEGGGIFCSRRNQSGYNVGYSVGISDSQAVIFGKSGAVVCGRRQAQ